MTQHTCTLVQKKSIWEQEIFLVWFDSLRSRLTVNIISWDGKVEVVHMWPTSRDGRDNAEIGNFSVI